MNIKYFLLFSILIMLFYFKGWYIYDFIGSFRNSEDYIIQFVDKNNLYCEEDILYWGEAPDKSSNYCNDFKGLKIPFKRKILDCE